MDAKSTAHVQEGGTRAASTAHVQEGGTRAAIYVRVSSVGQEQDGMSLQTQEERCRQYAAEHGYVVGEMHLYREVHTASELAERPQLTTLREVIRRREVDVLVCYAVDRLSRNQAHVYIIANDCEQAGVELAFVTERFEDTAVGKFIRSAKAFAAEIEHEKIKERTQRGRMARARAGKPVCGPTVPYGYAWNADKSAYLIDEATAAVVRRLFAEVLAGKTLRQIARELTADGIPSPRGYPYWNYPVIPKILLNQAYIGIGYAYRWQQVKIDGRLVHRLRDPEDWIPLPEGVIPPLVDRATFDAVASRLTLNKERSARNNRRPESYLLRGGFVHCGHCGSSMNAIQSKDGPVYQCSGPSRPVPVCRRVTIAYHILDDAVWGRVEAVLSDPEIIARELARLQRSDPTEVDLAALDSALASLDKKRNNLARRIAAIDDDDIVAPLVGELTLLGKQRGQLTAEREALLARRSGWKTAQNQAGSLQQWCRAVAARLGTLSYQERRLALDALGVEVKVYHADHDPRYSITASIPLGDSATIVSPTTTSKRHNSTAGYLTLRWTDGDLTAVQPA